MAANREYFQSAVKRHGFEGKGPGGDVDYLMKDFAEKTKGLDQDLAFKALDGGRQFGESDMARYNKLLKERDTATASKAKEKAQAQMNKTTSAEKAPPKLNEYQQSFQDAHDRYREKLTARQDAATAAMGDAYKTDISKYDYQSAGNKRFDMNDVKALRKAGYDDDAIASGQIMQGDIVGKY